MSIIARIIGVHTVVMNGNSNIFEDIRDAFCVAKGAFGRPLIIDIVVVKKLRKLPITIRTKLSAAQ